MMKRLVSSSSAMCAPLGPHQARYFFQQSSATTTASTGTTMRRLWSAFHGPNAANASTANSKSFFARTFQQRFHGGGGGGTGSYDYTKASKYNLFARYIRFCNEQQMPAAIVTSFVLWGLGDIITQKMESVAAKEKSKKDGGLVSSSHTESNGGFFASLDRRRLAATIAFGVSIAGIGGFYWYRLLDKVVAEWWRITPEKSGFAKFTAAKLGLEFVLWHPISLGLFWMYVGVLAEGKHPCQVLMQLKSDLPTALAADISLWLPIDIINFRFTPVHMQVIVVNLGSLFEAVLLSYLHGASDGHGHGKGSAEGKGKGADALAAIATA